jgi:hypothetical protein
MSDTRIEVNVATGVVTEIPLTPEEIQQRELDAIAAATAKAEQDTKDKALADLKASAKAKLIAGQPLTAEEADTLVI